jgi:hypothetical protein
MSWSLMPFKTTSTVVDSEVLDSGMRGLISTASFIELHLSNSPNDLKIYHITRVSAPKSVTPARRVIAKVEWHPRARGDEARGDSLEIGFWANFQCVLYKCRRKIKTEALQR